MDIESLEAANQSLQTDLKLAFKRIGDLQAAIEDEMESDDNEDLINKYKHKHTRMVQLSAEWKLAKCLSDHHFHYKVPNYHFLELSDTS